jgi:predicted ribosome quality control (RQC) complex YloA/Tae2 family protein
MRKIIKYIDAINTNIEFKVGQSAKENFDLIDESNPYDIWFHISERSSCHVVVTIPEGSNYDKKTLKKIIVQGAIICKQFSRYKSEKDISIIYTTINNVIKTEIVGTVSVEEYKKIII